MDAHATRRRFCTAAIAAASGALAGCLEENDDFDTGGRPVYLVIALETEAGEPVSEGVAVTIAHDETNFTANYRGGIDDGELVARTLADPGEYTVTVESTDDEFDPVERGVSLPAAEDDEEAESAAETITIVLEGATGDSERDEAAT